MHWQNGSDGFNAFVIKGLDLGKTAIHFAQLADRAHLLFDKEQAELTRMALKRQAGFSSGRWCAHQAQAQLALTPQAVGRAKRAPVWPDGVHGSITHTERIAAAVVSLDRHVGIDLERLNRLHEGLYKTLFTENEKAALSHAGQHADSIMFSAKESGYKAVYPLGHQFIGFHEAEISLNQNEQTFSIRYLGDHKPNEALNRGQGYWQIADAHVLTLFVID